MIEIVVFIVLKYMPGPLKILLLELKKGDASYYADMLCDTKEVEVLISSYASHIKTLKTFPDLILLNGENLKLNSPYSEVLRKMFPASKLLIYAGSNDQSSISELFALNAEGYLIYKPAEKNYCLLLKVWPAENCISAQNLQNTLSRASTPSMKSLRQPFIYQSRN